MWPAGCSLRTPAKRNLKAPIKLIQQPINSCGQCKSTHTFKSLITPRLTNAFVPNQALQIDFIGPLQIPFADKYACAIVYTATGILYAYASRHPNVKTTIQALSTWFSFYGPLHIFESDRGTHFTASSVQQQAQDLDVDWNFHLPYKTHKLLANRETQWPPQTQNANTTHGQVIQDTPRITRQSMSTTKLHTQGK